MLQVKDSASDQVLEERQTGTLATDGKANMCSTFAAVSFAKCRKEIDAFSAVVSCSNHATPKLSECLDVPNRVCHTQAFHILPVYINCLLAK